MGEKIFIAKESTSQQILAELLEQRSKRYGFRVKLSESDPSNRVEYLYDAQGMTPVRMDFDVEKFEYGSWADIWFVKNNFPCMVRSSGVVDYQLDPDDYSLRADGTGGSDVANEAYDGNAMSAIPCVWYKRWTDGEYYYFVACEEQYDESFCADVHTDKNGIVQPYKYAAMFEGSIIGETLRSISGKLPESGTTAAQELGYAKANGDAWTIKEWGVWCLIADLLILMGKSTDTQAVYGNGYIISNSVMENLLETGTLNTKGQFFGYNDRTHAMKVFHMENWWGERWDRIVGLVVDYGIVKAQISSCEHDYDFKGTNYEILGNILPDQSGYQSRVYSGRIGTFPVTADGREAAYECDFVNVRKDRVVVSLVGGSYTDGKKCGARYLVCADSETSKGALIGASLSLKKPT